MQVTHIDIPLKGSTKGEVIGVGMDELPEQAADILDILKEEEATRFLYLRFAVEYYLRDQREAFLELMENGLQDEEWFLKQEKVDKVEKIPVLNTMAAHYLNLANVATNEQERNGLLDKATSLFNQSDHINPKDVSTWIGKGVLLLLQRKLEQAAGQFKLLAERDPDNIAALFGRGCLLYHMEKYEEALKTYQQILKLGSDTNPDCRLGIAMCLWKLGFSDSARYALDRALKKNPKNVIALTLMATFFLNEAKRGTDSKDDVELSKAAVVKGVELLKQAQIIDKENPVLALHFADLLFQKNDLAKSLKLAQHALKGSNSTIIQGTACYFIGRVHHALKNFTDAHQFYSKAVDLYPTFSPAIFSLCQLHIHRGEYEEAGAKLKKLVSEDDNNHLGKLLLAVLYSKSRKTREKAVELLEQLTAARSADSTAWIYLAELLEATDIPGSINAYEQANRLFVQKGEISLQLLNNMGALLHSNHRYDDAEKIYTKAKSICEANAGNDASYQEILVVVLYNMARLYEEKGVDFYDKANELYTQLLEIDPQNADALLRRGCIIQAQGNFEEATDVFKDVIGSNEMNADAWILLASLDLTKNSFRPARGSFERVLKKIDSQDIYALVALGNDKLISGRMEASAEKQDVLYKDAAKFFDKALRRDPKNIYAAHGLAIALIETGNLSEARDALSQLRESATEVPSIQLNFAHLLVEMGQHRVAIAQYENINKKFHDGNDIQLNLFAARGYYVLARTEKNPADMLECIHRLEKALERLPDDITLKFNIALAMQQYAQLVTDLPAEKRTVPDLQAAMEHVDKSKELFEELQSIPDDKTSKLGFNAQLTGQRLKHGVYVRSNVSRRLTQQLANEEMQKERLEELKKRREEEERLEAARAEAEELKKREQEERLMKERMEMYNHLAIAQQEAQKAEELAAEAKKRSRSKGTDGFIASDDEDEPRTPSKSTKKSRRQLQDTQDQPEIGNDDEDVTPTKETPKKKRRLVSVGKASALSAEFVESSDEEGDDNDSIKSGATPDEDFMSNKKRLMVVDDE